MSAPSSPSVHGRIDVDLLDDGVLWLINSAVFHPRGYALGYEAASGRFQMLGVGREPWVYDEETAKEKHAALEAMLLRAQDHALLGGTEAPGTYEQCTYPSCGCPGGKVCGV
jgi:hypothetical protein